MRRLFRCRSKRSGGGGKDERKMEIGGQGHEEEVVGRHASPGIHIRDTVIEMAVTMHTINTVPEQQYFNYSGTTMGLNRDYNTTSENRLATKDKLRRCHVRHSESASFRAHCSTDGDHTS